MSRNSALKVLDHAMSGSDGADNCAKFVDILGLRTLFPLYMRPPKKHKKIGTSTKDHEGVPSFYFCINTKCYDLCY